MVTSYVRRMDRLSRVQYLLMVMFGTATVLLAVGLPPSKLRAAGVALCFGLTAGFWGSHLLQVVIDAVAASGAVPTNGD
jgi:hypothetical protein